MVADDTVDLDKLTAPFPAEAIKTREGGRGARLSYLQGHTVINRLNAATGNHWDFEVKQVWTERGGTTRDGEVVEVLCAQVRLTLPGLGTREHIGVQRIDPRGGEDLLKGAITDALKKAATLFGVGLELYGEDYEQPPEERHARTPQPPQTPRGPEPSRIPATRRQQQTPADAPVSVAADDVLRDELRELGTRGFDLNRFLTGRNKELGDLTRGELEGALPMARETVRKRVEKLGQQL